MSGHSPTHPHREPVPSDIRGLTSDAPHVPGRQHDILLVALIALRPLVWSGDAGAWDNLAWLLLAVGALMWLVADAWRGRVPAWRFGIGGLIATALLLILLPAALRSPYPSTGMGLWGMAVIHLGFAAYLMQVVPGRERLAFGALAGALVVECLVAFGQWGWVLPGMATALAGGDPAIAALENSNGDLADRVAHGGLFGTFTLANTLAAFLLLAAIPFVGVLMEGRGRQRLIAGTVIALAVIVAVGTASKGAGVALILAGAWVWTLHVRGRSRWVAAVALAIGGIAIAAIPALRDLGMASADVRLGYWHGAAALIGEAPVLGHGLHGFAAHGARAMPLTAEPARHVHNDVLEAAVDGGVFAGIALLALLGWCALKRPAAVSATPAARDDANRTLRSAWPLALFFPLFAALGMLVSNLEWWPLGASGSTWWLWPLVLSGVAIGVALVCACLPLPPPWAWRLALAAFALHCLVDFNLQSPGLWGTFIVVAVLAGGRTLAVGSCRISRTAVTVLVAGLALGLVFAIRQVVPRTLAAAGTMPQVDYDRAVALACQWPMDVGLLLHCLREQAGADRLAHSTIAAECLPWHGEAQEAFAVDLALNGRWDESLAAMRTAIASNPAYLPRRERLIGLLRFAAEALPSRSAVLLAEADEEERLITESAPRVHPRNRPRGMIPGHRSTLPVQPAP
jgi:O-antigen ligase